MTTTATAIIFDDAETLGKNLVRYSELLTYVDSKLGKALPKAKQTNIERLLALPEEITPRAAERVARESFQYASNWFKLLKEIERRKELVQTAIQCRVAFDEDVLAWDLIEVWDTAANGNRWDAVYEYAELFDVCFLESVSCYMAEHYADEAMHIMEGPLLEVICSKL